MIDVVCRPAEGPPSIGVPHLQARSVMVTPQEMERATHDCRVGHLQEVDISSIVYSCERGRESVCVSTDPQEEQTLFRAPMETCMTRVATILWLSSVCMHKRGIYVQGVGRKVGP